MIIESEAIVIAPAENVRESSRPPDPKAPRRGYRLTVYQSRVGSCVPPLNTEMPPRVYDERVETGLEREVFFKGLKNGDLGPRPACLRGKENGWVA